MQRFFFFFFFFFFAGVMIKLLGMKIDIALSLFVIVQ